MRSHDMIFFTSFIDGHIYIHYIRQMHSRPEIIKALSLIQHGITLYVATLADVKLKRYGELSWVYNGVIYFFGNVDKFALHLLFHMLATGTVTPLTIYSVGNLCVFVLRAFNDIRIRVMAT